MEQEIAREGLNLLEHSVYIISGAFLFLFLILQPFSLKSIYGGVIAAEKRTPSYFLCLISINSSIVITIFLVAYFFFDILNLYAFDSQDFLDPETSYKNLVLMFGSVMSLPLILNALVLGTLMQLMYWHTNIMVHGLVAILYQLLNILILYPLMLYLIYILEFDLLTDYIESIIGAAT